MTKQTESLLLKPREAARLCQVSVSTVYRACQAGDLPVVRWGRSVRLNRKALEEWISMNTTGGMDR